MAFITKPERVNPKELIKSETINKIIQGLEDVENYLENLTVQLPFTVDFGKVENIPTNQVGTFTYQVSFNKTFNTIPYIFLTVENLNDKVDVNIWVSNASVNGFILNVKVIRARPNSYCNVNWMAIA